MQRVDQHEGMLVDRVAVIGVADDEGIDAMKLGDEQFENAQCVHGSKRIAGKASHQHGLQAAPECGSFFQVR